jgi:hypothetical protein
MKAKIYVKRVLFGEFIGFVFSDELPISLVQKLGIDTAYDQSVPVFGTFSECGIGSLLLTDVDNNEILVDHSIFDIVDLMDNLLERLGAS